MDGVLGFLGTDGMRRLRSRPVLHLHMVKMNQCQGVRTIVERANLV
jgi:hypothetical protein